MHPLKMGKAGIAGAEVINGKADPGHAQALCRTAHPLRIGHGDALRNFQLQKRRREARPVQNLQHA